MFSSSISPIVHIIDVLSVTKESHANVTVCVSDFINIFIHYKRLCNLSDSYINDRLRLVTSCTNLTGSTYCAP